MNKKSGPPIEDMRVAEAWARQDVRDAIAVRTRDEERRLATMADGGKDRTQLTAVDVVISQDRTETRVHRARPGSFEWKYGRDRDTSALYHAGIELATLWERAGIASAGGADWLGSGGKGVGGITDGRLAVMDKIKVATFGEPDSKGNRTGGLGQHCMQRLFDYCVAGMTTTEIANKYGRRLRDMTIVLDQDLHDCAVEFKFLNPRKAA